MLWLFYDPFTLALLSVGYVLGWLALLFLASRVAPRIAASAAGRLGLHAAMLLTAAVIVAGGGLAIYGIYAAAAARGYQLSLEAMVAVVAFLNLLSYLAAPFMINLSMGARPSPELQRIVDEVAARAGMKPPRAVLVEGPPNAFAYGNFLTGRYVAVSRSLYEMLPREELEAVVGHELGHHRHRDVVIIMLLGLVPSILYYLGVSLVHAALWGGYSGDREERGGGLYLAALGLASIVLSFLMQAAVLAFSRLREYYADAHGALVAGARSMQRALARLHLYYSNPRARAELDRAAGLRALFIYALVEAVAQPFYSPWGSRGWGADIDAVVEELKRAPVNPVEEVLSDHPPIPKRLRFLDQVARAGRPQATTVF